MKTQIQKIIISAAALVFLSSGVSFAQDRDRQNHKQQGKADRHYKVKKDHPDWSNKHLKTWKHFRKMNWKHLRKMNRKNLRRHQLTGYYCEDGILHYYDKRDRRWKDDHSKQRRHHRDRYGYKEGHHNRHDDYHHRSDRREDAVYKRAFKDPGMVFKLIVKND